MGSTTATLNADNAGTLALALTALNTQLSGSGIYAVQTAGATGNISFQSANSFTVDETAFTAPRRAAREICLARRAR